MATDIKTRYNLIKTKDNEYQLSVKGSMNWFGGFLLFMFFSILLTLAFFIPLGYSIVEYLKIVIPLFLIFTGIAFFAGLFFKKSGDKTFVFNTTEFSVSQSKKSFSENWENLKLPEKGIIVRDSYKYIMKKLTSDTSSAVGTKDSMHSQIVTINRLMIIDGSKYNSKKDILEKISYYENNIREKTYTLDEKPELPENAVLLSSSGLNEYQDILIEGLIKIFDWELIDFLTSPPEIYDKQSMSNVSLEKISDNIEKPDKVPLLKEKIKKDTIIFTLIKMPVYLKLIVLFIMAAFSAFYGFFAVVKNNTNFWLAFFPMFIVWFLVLSVKTKIYLTKEQIFKIPVLLGVPILSKQVVNLEDIGDIKILNKGNFKLVFYKKGGRQTLFSVTLPNKKSGEYIIHKIVEVIKNKR